MQVQGGEAGAGGAEGGETEPPDKTVLGGGKTSGLVDGGALVAVPPLPEAAEAGDEGEREMIQGLPIVAPVRDAVGEVLEDQLILCQQMLMGGD